jgi:hypothetical protein
VNWLNEAIGGAALAEIKNEVAKQLVIKMKAQVWDSSCQTWKVQLGYLGYQSSKNRS